MTVYYDGDTYCVLVENSAVKRGTFELNGLLHYCSRGGSDLEIFDGSTGVFYELDVKWTGLDWNALNALLDEVEGITQVAVAPDDWYYEKIGANDAQ